MSLLYIAVHCIIQCHQSTRYINWCGRKLQVCPVGPGFLFLKAAIQDPGNSNHTSLLRRSSAVAGHVAADSVLSSSPLGLTVVHTTLIRLHLLLIWQLHADLRSVYMVACGMVYVYMFLLHESGMHDLLQSPKSISQMHATICNQKWHTVELLYSRHHRKPAVSLCRVVSPFRGT